MSELAGFLIAFEGTEGAGKSTQLELASQALKRAGHRVHVTLEPGGTPLGKEIRQLLLHRADAIPTPLAELFLYLADRSQHLAEVVRPHLESGADEDQLPGQVHHGRKGRRPACKGGVDVQPGQHRALGVAGVLT